MGQKKKLQRFAENLTFDNFFQYQYEQLQSDGFPLKGRWHEAFFKNENPIIVELGCGKGEYAVGLARQYPDKNFIGVDIKGARMWRGLKTAKEEQLTNVAFLRTRIELIEHYFASGEVSEIWITFPDPQPRKSRAHKRLTSPRFINRYRNILKPEGVIHLKTDDMPLYAYTLEVIREGGHRLVFHTPDLYKLTDELDVKKIRTFYEQIWLEQGLTIKYIQFSLAF